MQFDLKARWKAVKLLRRAVKAVRGEEGNGDHVKLSTETRHRAPRMKVRMLNGKLKTRVYWTRSNAPGGGKHHVIVKPSDNELVVKPPQEGMLISGRDAQKEMSMFNRIMARLRGDR